MITSIQHREVRKLLFLIQTTLQNHRSNSFGLIFVRLCRKDFDTITKSLVAPERFFKNVRVVCNQGIRRF